MTVAARVAQPFYTPSANGRLSIIKRDQSNVPFVADKIECAITKAILAVEGPAASSSVRVKELAQRLSREITEGYTKRFPNGGTLRIEDVQDQVELSLMREGMHKVARAYVLYREARASERNDVSSRLDQPSITVTNPDGSRSTLDIVRIHSVIMNACDGLEGVDGPSLSKKAIGALYDGMKKGDVITAISMVARQLIELEPNYSFVCARLLLSSLTSEALSILNPAAVETTPLKSLYPELLSLSINKCVELGLLTSELLTFDLDHLGQAINSDADLQFNFLGLQTLYDRYFLHSNGVRIELPQIFFMRVAMGLALREDNPNSRAIEFYNLMSSFDYMPSTPTLFNSGTCHPQLSSCYLTTVQDDLSGIYNSLHANALLSKWAGGLGNDWTRVRALGSAIKGTNGQSQGVVPFLKVFNDTAVAVNQGGKRKGAVCAYLESWHLDIEDFLELRKNTGDERRRTHDMNTANWIPDLLMKRVIAESHWTLFSPNDVPELHDLFGQAFESQYLKYEEMAERGEIKLFRRVSAQNLWRKMLSMLFETGHPWITFKDPCNIRSPQQHAGVVHSSNLCTEITLNTSDNEIAVCNLGSINLSHHILQGVLDVDRLERTVKTAIRMLDNVIDLNFYAVPEAKASNLKHRPIGLGVMGFQDALYQLGLPYCSNDAVNFADLSMEYISYFAIKYSSGLAQERGKYNSFDGSHWEKGILPIDSIAMLIKERGAEYTTINTSQHLDWEPIREMIRTHGMRNSNVMAIAPTATISNIVGVSQSIEPTYQNLFVKSNLSGEFVSVNPWLVKELKALNLWDESMVNDLKYYDGSLKSINRIPEHIKALFVTAFELDPLWLVDAASRRQKWIDQAQSLNLYMAEASGRRLDILYKSAWTKGLKTTYYLRSLGATQVKESPMHSTAKFCSTLSGECEACQ